MEVLILQMSQDETGDAVNALPSRSHSAASPDHRGDEDDEDDEQKPHPLPDACHAANPAEHEAASPRFLFHREASRRVGDTGLITLIVARRHGNAATRSNLASLANNTGASHYLGAGIGPPI